MDDSANTSEPQQLSDASIRRLLSAVHEALGVAVPARGRRRLACLMLLEHRARIARAGIARLIWRFPAPLAVPAAASSADAASTPSGGHTIPTGGGLQ